MSWQQHDSSRARQRAAGFAVSMDADTQKPNRLGQDGPTLCYVSAISISLFWCWRYL